MSYLDDLFSLRDRTAVVTGASSGIGFAIAEALARAGAAVVLVARDESRLETAASQVTAQGLPAVSLSADLGVRAQLDGLCSELTVRGLEPDILVNAAGVNPRPPMADLTDDDVAETMAVNLTAPFLLGQYAGPRMAQRGWGGSSTSHRSRRSVPSATAGSTG